MSLTKVCSYCGKIIRRGSQAEPVSHGICKSCDKKIRKGMRNNNPK